MHTRSVSDMSWLIRSNAAGSRGGTSLLQNTTRWARVRPSTSSMTVRESCHSSEIGLGTGAVRVLCLERCRRGPPPRSAAAPAGPPRRRRSPRSALGSSVGETSSTKAPLPYSRRPSGSMRTAESARLRRSSAARRSRMPNACAVAGSPPAPSTPRRRTAAAGDRPRSGDRRRISRSSLTALPHPAAHHRPGGLVGGRRGRLLQRV
jgi:hypothetical protein